MVPSRRPFLLVNSNVSRPPVSPVGLEYTGEALRQAGFRVEVLDLAWEDDWQQALEHMPPDPLAVGLSLRNTDDCSFATRHSFLPWIAKLVAEIRRRTPAPVVLGGVGFSVDPQGSIRATGADLGIEGDGEGAAVLLARTLEGGQDPSRIPGLVYQRDGAVIRNGRRPPDPASFPSFRRDLFDNGRYEREGAIVGVETKRGCPGKCIYCADPVAKGRTTRPRPPERVAQEIENLVLRGVSWLHLADSEFNLPLAHATEVCQALLHHHLGGKVGWYCYCSPLPWDPGLARLMKQAGCAGINFGVDSLDDGQLKRLGRPHRKKDVQELVRALKGEGMNFMFDLLLGAPGETESTVKYTLEEARRLEVPLVGVAVGARVYPGTPLGARHLKEGLQPAKPAPGEPLYYISPVLGPHPQELVRALAGDDPRFLLLAAPDQPGSYNYAGDQLLSQAIARGERGAYWDILRRMRGIPPTG